jgi:hypothetical protein
MVVVNSVPDLTSAFPNNKKVAASKFLDVGCLGINAVGSGQV